MKKIAVTLLYAAVMSACSVVIGRPERGIEVRDRARVCFHRSENAEITAFVEPSACYSIRCTRVNHKSGTAVLDQRKYRLHFETTFNLTAMESLLGACTPDCAGGGQLDFDLGHLEAGIYDVYLWDDAIGELSVAAGLPWRDHCLARTGPE